MATDEIELNTRKTAWVKGGASATMGHATLTSERLLFFRERFMAGATGGAIGAAVGAMLTKGSEAGGPLLVVPLESITGWHREKKLLGKDRIVLATTTEPYTFSDGWKEWTPLLVQALRARGRTVAEAGTDAWRVSAA